MHAADTCGGTLIDDFRQATATALGVSVARVNVTCAPTTVAGRRRTLALSLDVGARVTMPSAEAAQTTQQAVVQGLQQFVEQVVQALPPATKEAVGSSVSLR